MKNVGTMSIGVRTGVIKEGDNLAEITVNSVLNACEELNLPLEYKDIISASRILYDVLPSDIAREMRESIMERYGNTWAIDFSVSNDFKPHVSKQHSYIYRELQFAIASILSNTDLKKACSDYQKLSKHEFEGDDKLIEKLVLHQKQCI